MTAPTERRSALLIIDLQVALLAGAYLEHEIVDRVRLLIEKARAASVPLIYAQHNHTTFQPMVMGQPGWKIHSAIAPHEGDILIEKEASDAFFQTALEEKLRGLGIDTIFIAGMQTEFCVDTTARAALSHGFNVVLVSDCHTTGDGQIPAQTIIDHHNRTLAALAHPRQAIQTMSSREIELQAF